MNSKERVLTALAVQQPDRVPTWELAINQPVIRGILKDESRAIGDLNAYMVLADRLEIDGLTAFEAMNYQKAGKNTLRDEWGIDYRIGEQGEKFPLDGPISSADDLKGFSAPDPAKSYRWNTLKIMKAFVENSRALSVCVHDSFEYSWFLRGGMEEFFLDLHRNPDLVRKIIDIVVDYNIGLVRHAAAVGANFVVSGDDYAYNSGLLISPDQFEEFLLPGLRRLVEATHDSGMLFLKHTDGDITKLLPQLVDAGIDGLCPIEPAAGMDIGEVKSQYGDEIAVVGNIDVSELLPRGSPDQVRRAVRDCLQKAGPGGGHILSSSNTIHYDVKPRNYLAMIEALHDFGQYPLNL